MIAALPWTEVTRRERVFATINAEPPVQFIPAYWRKLRMALN